MTAPNREQFQNNAFSALDGGITDVATTADVDDGSVFPSVGNFRILIDDEIILVTARSSDTLTIVRGQEGTTNVAHSDDAKVTHVLTQGALQRILKDNLPFADVSSRPILNSLTDANEAVIDSSDFAWINQGSATATDHNGTVLLTAPAAAGENIRLLKKAPPSTPYSIIAAFVPCVTIAGGTGQPSFGICFRESSTGKIYSITCELVNDNTSHMSIFKYPNATSTPTSVVKRHDWLTPLFPLWLKIRDDATNLKFFISPNGFDWIEAQSEGRTAFMIGSGPDEIGFYLNLNGQNVLPNMVELVHWSEE